VDIFIPVWVMISGVACFGFIVGVISISISIAGFLVTRSRKAEAREDRYPVKKVSKEALKPVPGNDKIT
jgi:hypothetical protein